MMQKKIVITKLKDGNSLGFITHRIKGGGRNTNFGVGNGRYLGFIASGRCELVRNEDTSAQEEVLKVRIRKCLWDEHGNAFNLTNELGIPFPFDAEATDRCLEPRNPPIEMDQRVQKLRNTNGFEMFRVHFLRNENYLESNNGIVRDYILLPGDRAAIFKANGAVIDTRTLLVSDQWPNHLQKRINQLRKSHPDFMAKVRA